MKCVLCNNNNITDDEECQVCGALLPEQHRFLQSFTIECGEKDGKMVVTAKVGERVELMTSEPNAECECAVISINFKGNQIAVTVIDNPSKPILFSVARQIVHPQPEENVVTAKVNPVYRG